MSATAVQQSMDSRQGFELRMADNVHSPEPRQPSAPHTSKPSSSPWDSSSGEFQKTALTDQKENSDSIRGHSLNTIGPESYSSDKLNSSSQAQFIDYTPKSVSYESNYLNSRANSGTFYDKPLNGSYMSNFSSIVSSSNRDKFNVDDFMRDVKSGKYSDGESKAPDVESVHGESSQPEMNSSPTNSPSVTTNGTQSGSSSGTASRQDFSFESSDLGLKLKSTLQSEFLSKEFQPSSGGGGRSIDDIMRDYGVSSRPYSSADSYTRSYLSSSLGYMNVSANNESSKFQPASIDTLSLSRIGHTLNNNHPETLGTYSEISIRSNNFSSSIDIPKDSSISLDEKPLSMVGVNNVSQNNETAPQEDQDMRNFGSSVDYSTALNYRSMSTTSQLYSSITDLGKVGTYSGDITLKPTTSKHNPVEAKKSEAALGPSGSVTSKQTSVDYVKPPMDTGKYRGTVYYGEMAKTLPSSWGTGSQYPFNSHIGSTSDALGFSLQAERQRLRNIDAMISTTPFHSRAHEIPIKPYSSRFVTGHTFGSSELEGRRRYSTPHFNPAVSTRVDWSSTLGQNPMGKSISAPNEYSRSLHATGSSVDASYLSGNNFQYNNCTYNPPLVHKTNDKKSSENSRGQTPKESCPFRNMKKRDSKGGSCSPVRHALSRPTSDAVVSLRDKRGQGKTVQRSASCSRKKEKLDEYKIGNVFEFVKDLNKMWQQSIVGEGGKRVKIVPKYQPYQPTSNTSVKTASDKRAIFDRSTGQIRPQKSQSCRVSREMYESAGEKENVSGRENSAKNKRVKSAKSFTAETTTPKSILKQSSKVVASRSASVTPNKSFLKSTPVPPRFPGNQLTTAQMFAGLTLKKKATSSKNSRKPQSAAKASNKIKQK